MVTLLDVLHKIGIEKFKSTAKLESVDLNVCITNDVEKSEYDFMTKYGAGNTYYFRLENYHHGRKLAAALYQLIKGYILDIPEHILNKSNINKTLYFFVHIREQQETSAALLS